MPDNFVAEALVSEEFVQFHFEVVGGMPIAVQIEVSRHFEQAAAFEQAGVPPSQIARQALLPYIGKTALLVVFPSRDAILFLAKERRIGVNQIHALHRQRPHRLQIIPAKDSVGRQGRSGCSNFTAQPLETASQHTGRFCKNLGACPNLSALFPPARS